VRRLLLAVLAPLMVAASATAAPIWDPGPWLGDLAQIRAAVDRDYPNRDWLTGELEVSLDQWFSRTAEAISSGESDADARRALDDLIKRFDDGHVALRWPGRAGAAPVTPPPATLAGFCAALGYDARQVTAGTAAALPGYQTVDGGGSLAAGTVRVGETSVGIVRIGVFSPHGYPKLCEQAVANTRTAIGDACHAACGDRVLTEASALLTRGLMTTIERLRSAGARVLIVDVTRNGGGTEWTEAAARIVSPVPIRSAPVGVLRGEAWVRRWRERAAVLRREARIASRADRGMLRDLAGRADAIAKGLAPCPDQTCPRLAAAGYGSGLLAELPAGRLDGKSWGPDVFSPARFPYRDAVWTGPLIVLVDDETWSAAEEFAALLQDNGAAVVMGARTGGAGCGRMNGGAPITLAHSKARLELPNCVRFRKDGSNEVSGIIPDVLTGVRWNDGPGYAGRLTAARLPEAVARAKALAAR